MYDHLAYLSELLHISQVGSLMPHATFSSNIVTPFEIKDRAYCSLNCPLAVFPSSAVDDDEESASGVDHDCTWTESNLRIVGAWHNCHRVM